MSTELILKSPDTLRESLSALYDSFGKYEIAPVVGPAEREGAHLQITELKRTLKEIEAAEKGFLKPFNEQIAEYKGWFKTLKGRIDAILSDGKAKVLAYDAEVAAKVEAARALAQAEADAEAIIEGTEPVKIGIVEVKHEGARTVKKYEITDADLVPREFCEPSAGKIWRFIQSGGEIPGVRVWEEKILAAKAA